MNYAIKHLFVSSLTLCLIACTPSEKLAETSNSPATQPETTENILAEVPSGTYDMDQTHGYITFTYNHLGYSKPILRYTYFNSSVSLDTENPANSAVTASINTNSLDSGVKELDARLMKEDFFNAEAFPTIMYESKTIEVTGPNTAVISGDLTINGVTKTISLDTVMHGARNHPRDGMPTFGISATTTLDRQDFDLGYLVPHVGAEIDVTISAEYNLTKE